MQSLPLVPRSPRTRAAQQGFTLIELIVVLVILGILAAFAIPRFAGVNEDARRAAVQGLAGSLRSATALTRGLALARNETGATGSVSMEGQAIALVNGYPAASLTGVHLTVLNLDGFHPPTISGTTVRYVPLSLPATQTTCSVLYNQVGGLVTADVSDCA